MPNAILGLQLKALSQLVAHVWGGVGSLGLLAPAAKLCKTVGSKKNAPDVMILRTDMSMWVMAPGSEECTVEPCELLGFNTGTFNVSEQPVEGRGLASRCSLGTRAACVQYPARLEWTPASH